MVLPSGLEISCQFSGRLLSTRVARPPWSPDSWGVGIPQGRWGCDQGRDSCACSTPSASQVQPVSLVLAAPQPALRYSLAKPWAPQNRKQERLQFCSLMGGWNVCVCSFFFISPISCCPQLPQARVDIGNGALRATGKVSSQAQLLNQRPRLEACGCLLTPNNLTEIPGHPPLPAVETEAYKEILRKGPQVAMGTLPFFKKRHFHLLYHFVSGWPWLKTRRKGSVSSLVFLVLDALVSLQLPSIPPSSKWCSS